MEGALGIALNSSAFASLTEKVKKTLIEILYALKEQLPKVKLCLVNMNGIAQGLVGEDSLIGLEMTARNAI